MFRFFIIILTMSQCLLSTLEFLAVALKFIHFIFFKRIVAFITILQRDENSVLLSLFFTLIFNRITLSVWHTFSFFFVFFVYQNVAFHFTFPIFPVYCWMINWIFVLFQHRLTLLEGNHIKILPLYFRQCGNYSECYTDCFD